MTRLICPLASLMLACAAGDKVAEGTHAPASQARSYATDFPGTESPISEGGHWTNGGTDGSDWTDVSTTPHRAIGHQVGPSYTDATALLGPPWRPDQRASATVFATRSLDDACYSEVELRLRSMISPHLNRGYEVSFKVSDTDAAYLIIVRWNGKLGDFTYLLRQNGKDFGVKNGDTVEATIVGSTISVFKNGARIGQASDDTYADGAPGMGFNLENGKASCRGTNGDYGFSSFAATDAPRP